jgi:Immunity protein 49
MKIIIRHQVDEVKYLPIKNQFERSTTSFNNFIHTIIEYLPQSKIEPLRERFCSGFLEACYLNEINWAKTFLYHSNELSRLIYELSYNEGKEILVEYNGESRQIEGYIVTSRFNRYTFWKQCIPDAILLRSEPVLSLLKKQDKEELYDNDLKGGYNLQNSPIHKLELSLLYNLIHQNEVEALETTNEMILQLNTKPSIMLGNYNQWKSVRDSTELLTLPWLNCLKLYFERDEKQLNEKLYEALQKHKDFCEMIYSKRELAGGSPNSNQDYCFVSKDLLMVCCLAHDKGMKVEVESDYLPQWIIEKDFEFENPTKTI